MGGGRVEGGEKRNFPWKHFPVYLTIVPPTKASQISPPINSKPARVPCCDLTASQMIQRMQHWAADIYFQFHVDLHPGGLGVLCLRVTGSVLHGESKAVGREQKKWEPWDLVLGMQHGSRAVISWKGVQQYSLLFYLSLIHAQVHLGSGYLVCSVSTSKKYMKSHYFLLKRNFPLVQRIWNRRHIFREYQYFIIM